MIARKLVIDRQRALGAVMADRPSQSFGGGSPPNAFGALVDGLNTALNALAANALKGIWIPQLGIQSSAGVVTRWRDARFFGQNNAWDWTFTGSARPALTLESTLGLLVPTFDGVDDISDNNTGANPWTNNIGSLVCSVVGRTTDTSIERTVLRIVDGAGAGPNRTLIDSVYSGGVNAHADFVRLDGGVSVNLLGGTATQTSPKRMTTTADYTNSDYKFFHTGVQVAASTPSAAGNTSATDALANRLGSDNGTHLHIGPIAGCIICIPGSANVAAARTLIDQFWVDLFGSTV